MHNDNKKRHPKRNPRKWLAMYALGGRAAVVGELAGGGEHDDGELSVAEHAQLVGLLHDAGSPLGVGHLPVGRVLDLLDLDLALPHLDRSPLSFLAAR